MNKLGKKLDGRDFSLDIICLKEKKKTYQKIIKDMSEEEKEQFDKLCKENNIKILEENNETKQ